MDEKFNSILSVVLLPQIISLIADNEGLDDLSAVNNFYQSKVYDLLCEEQTKLWHFSPLTIYMMYKTEKETGVVVFPED